MQKNMEYYKNVYDKPYKKILLKKNNNYMKIKALLIS